MNQTTPGSGPPPLPPRPARPAPPQARKMHGCLIAVIVAACLLVPTTGILAAIAIPAYNDYLARSRVAQAMADTTPLKLEVARFHAEHQRCPRNADDGFQAPDAYQGDSHASIMLGDADDGRCALDVRLRDPKHEAIDGKRLQLEYDGASGTWQCRSDAEDRYLPAGCRG